MLDFLVNNDFLSSVIAFVIVLIPAVIIHEFGHFLAAKAVGITVLEFGVGFPPRMVKLFNWGETEFTLNWLPLGGFVRPLGEDMIRPLSEEETQREREKLLKKLGQAPSDTDREVTETPQTYQSEREELAARGIVDVKSINEVKPLPRIFFMLAGALANFLSAFLIFILIGLIGVPQRAGAGILLIDVQPDSMLGKAGFVAGDFIETINGQKFETNREITQALAEQSGEEVTISYVPLDEVNSVERTFVVDAASAEALAKADGLLIVQSIQETSPAATAGIELEDIIIQFAGQELRDKDDPFAELQRLTRIHEGTEVEMTVIRNGESITLLIIPRVDPPPDAGRIGVGLDPQFVSTTAGISYVAGFQREYVPLTLVGSLQYGLERVTNILRSILEFPIRMLRQETSSEENRIVSIVGVSQLGGEVLQDSIAANRPVEILEYIALISIALGFTNLLPIPALDGGRILFALIEIVRGKPIAPEREGLIHLIGLAFLLSIGIIVILNDIVNPLTDLLP